MKRVEIVTPVHNRRELTLQCLKSLSRIDRAGLDVHIIIVDDGSTDGTAGAIRENYPEVEIVEGDGNLWYSAGTNLGIETALKYNPDYILGINDDSIFDEKFLRRLIECAEKYPRSVIGALLLLWDTPHKVFQVSPKWNVFEGGWRYWQNQTVWTIPQKPWQVEVIVGNCILYPAQVIKEVGLLNPGVSAQYGDAEYTRRINKKGWRLLIEPRARVFCQPNYAPKKVLSLPLKQKIKTLFLNKKDGHNLIHRFYFYLYSAPTKLQGFAAFWIFFIRWGWNRLFGVSPENEQKEPDLAITYKNAVVKN
ncbi:MAG: glycosyltransferase family 2 protein [Pyrinomonadaceae bacterium]